MANKQAINFSTAFLSDGSSSTVVVDLSEATSFSSPTGSSVPVDVRLASGLFGVGLSGGLTVNSWSLSKGALTVNFTNDPSTANSTITVSGLLLF